MYHPVRRGIIMYIYIHIIIRLRLVPLSCQGQFRATTRSGPDEALTKKCRYASSTLFEDCSLQSSSFGFVSSPIKI